MAPARRSALDGENHDRVADGRHLSSPTKVELAIVRAALVKEAHPVSVAADRVVPRLARLAGRQDLCLRAQVVLRITSAVVMDVDHGNAVFVDPSGEAPQVLPPVQVRVDQVPVRLPGADEAVE